MRAESVAAVLNAGSSGWRLGKPSGDCLPFRYLHLDTLVGGTANVCACGHEAGLPQWKRTRLAGREVTTGGRA